MCSTVLRLFSIKIHISFELPLIGYGERGGEGINSLLETTVGILKVLISS